MDFVTVEGRALKHALSLVIGAVDGRTTVPVLKCIKLSFDADGLRLEATDLDITISTRLDAIDGAGEWSAMLTARELLAIARISGAAPVRIEPGEKALITLGEGAGAVRYELDCPAAADFPELMPERGELVERFADGQLAAHLDKVRACISTEETRYYLNGVAWLQGSKGARMVATDGHRLQVCTYDAAARPEQPTRIIPRKAVNLLARLARQGEVAVHAWPDKRLGLTFVCAALTLSTKLIDGTFPDFDKILAGVEAAGAPFRLVVNRGKALSALARLTALGGDAFAVVRFEEADGRLRLVRKTGAGTASAALAARWPTDGERTLPSFGANGAYLLPLLHGCEGEVTLGLSDASSPVLIRDNDPTMTRVLMPMRV